MLYEDEQYLTKISPTFQDGYELKPAQPFVMQRALVIGIGIFGEASLTPFNTFDLSQDQAVSQVGTKANFGRRLEEILKPIYTKAQAQKPFASTLHFSALRFAYAQNEPNKGNVYWTGNLQTDGGESDPELSTTIEAKTTNLRSTIFDALNGERNEAGRLIVSDIRRILADLGQTSLNPQGELERVDIYLVTSLDYWENSALLWGLSGLLRQHILPYNNSRLIGLLSTGPLISHLESFLKPKEAVGLALAELQAVQIGIEKTPTENDEGIDQKSGSEVEAKESQESQTALDTSLDKLREATLKIAGYCRPCQQRYLAGQNTCQKCHTPIFQPSGLFDRCYLLTGQKYRGQTAEASEFDENIHNALEVMLYSAHYRHYEEQCLDSYGPTQPATNLSSFGSAARELPVFGIRSWHARTVAAQLLTQAFLQEHETLRPHAIESADVLIEQYLKPHLLHKRLSADSNVLLDQPLSDNNNSGKLNIEVPRALGSLSLEQEQEYEIYLEKTLGPIAKVGQGVTTNPLREQMQKEGVALKKQVSATIRATANDFVTTHEQNNGLHELQTYLTELENHCNKSLNDKANLLVKTEENLNSNALYGYQTLYRETLNNLPSPPAVLLRESLLYSLIVAFFNQHDIQSALLPRYDVWLHPFTFGIVASLMLILTAIWFAVSYIVLTHRRETYLNYLTEFHARQYLTDLQEETERVYRELREDTIEPSQNVLKEMIEALEQFVELVDQKNATQNLVQQTETEGILRQSFDDRRLWQRWLPSDQEYIELGQQNLLRKLPFLRVWDFAFKQGHITDDQRQQNSPQSLAFLVFGTATELARQEFDKKLRNWRMGEALVADSYERLRLLARPFVDFDQTSTLEYPVFKLEYLMLQDPTHSSLIHKAHHQNPNLIALNSPDPFSIIFLTEMHGLKFEALTGLELFHQARYQMSLNQLNKYCLFGPPPPEPPTFQPLPTPPTTPPGSGGTAREQDASDEAPINDSDDPLSDLDDRDYTDDAWNDAPTPYTPDKTNSGSSPDVSEEYESANSTDPSELVEENEGNTEDTLDVGELAEDSNGDTITRQETNLATNDQPVADLVAVEPLLGPADLQATEVIEPLADETAIQAAVELASPTPSRPKASRIPESLQKHLREGNDLAFTFIGREFERFLRAEGVYNDSMTPKEGWEYVKKLWEEEQRSDS